MTTSVTLNVYDCDNQKQLIDNYHYLADCRCLKQRLCHAPLGLRRSVSLEDSSTDSDIKSSQKPTDKQLSNTLATQNTQLSSSLNSLCLKLRRYQLLPEYNEELARSSHEHDFNWWRAVARLKPILERVIMSDYKANRYVPGTYQTDEEIAFRKCKRQQRRNAVCIGVDRLYYNEQLALIATVANEVQFEFNLTFSGFDD